MSEYNYQLEAAETIGVLYKSYQKLPSLISDFLNKIEVKLKDLSRYPKDDHSTILDDLEKFKTESQIDNNVEAIGRNEIPKIRKTLKKLSDPTEKMLKRIMKLRKSMKFSGTFNRLNFKSIYRQRNSPVDMKTINTNVRALRRCIDWAEKCLLDLMEHISRDSNHLTLIDKVYMKGKIFENGEFEMNPKMIYPEAGYGDQDIDIIGAHRDKIRSARDWERIIKMKKGSAFINSNDMERMKKTGNRKMESTDEDLDWIESYLMEENWRDSLSNIGKKIKGFLGGKSLAKLQNTDKLLIKGNKNVDLNSIEKISKTLEKLSSHYNAQIMITGPGTKYPKIYVMGGARCYALPKEKLQELLKGDAVASFFHDVGKSNYKNIILFQPNILTIHAKTASELEVIFRHELGHCHTFSQITPEQWKDYMLKVSFMGVLKNVTTNEADDQLAYQSLYPEKIANEKMGIDPKMLVKLTAGELPTAAWQSGPCYKLAQTQFPRSFNSDSEKVKFVDGLLRKILLGNLYQKGMELGFQQHCVGLIERVDDFDEASYIVENEDLKEESLPKKVDREESDKNGVRRKKLYIAFIEWSKTFNQKNTFGSIFDPDAFKTTYPFIPHELRYFYRLSNPTLCVLSGNLTFFPASELRKLNMKNSRLSEMIIFAATDKDLRVFNIKDKKVYLATEENGMLKLGQVLGNAFDTYLQQMIGKGDILNAPLEESVEVI